MIRTEEPSQEEFSDLISNSIRKSGSVRQTFQHQENAMNKSGLRIQPKIKAQQELKSLFKKEKENSDQSNFGRQSTPSEEIKQEPLSLGLELLLKAEAENDFKSLVQLLESTDPLNGNLPNFYIEDWAFKPT